MTLEVTFSDHHLEHRGSRVGGPEGQGAVGGGMERRAPQGSADSEEGQGKAGSGEHWGPVQLRCSVLGRCPGPAVTLGLTWLSADI